MGNSTSATKEFGDFQTPAALAERVCELCRHLKLEPAAILEPNCGHGQLLAAGMAAFPGCQRFVGSDINPDYVRMARERLDRGSPVEVSQQDFFQIDWSRFVAQLPQPVLVVGNPPWVTNSELGRLGSSNVPTKTNDTRESGIDALTGKSNFDISEWMLSRLLRALDGTEAGMAMLCKTAVARKVLKQAWADGVQLASAACYRVDAARYFKASVDACLLLCRLSPGGLSRLATDYPSLDAEQPHGRFGLQAGRLLADVDAFQRHAHLQGSAAPYQWRSGVKHDCSRVMELDRDGAAFRNGFGESVQLEDEFLFPLLKSSQVASPQRAHVSRWMLVTQRKVGEETGSIEKRAPLTWAYLQRHAERLEQRRSSVYRKRPPFSIFGVGDYTFAPWKVATSGFYKRLHFKVIGPSAKKPVVLDDTSYFLPCRTRREAQLLATLLNGEAARQYLGSLIFWDAKRPVTAAVLRELDLLALARSESVDLQRESDRNPWAKG